MTDLERFEARILELHETLNLKTNLTRAVELGEMLIEVRSRIPKQFTDWCKRFPFGYRTVQIYMQVAGNADLIPKGEYLSIDGFVKTIRRITKKQSAPAPDDTADAHPRAEVHHADCREFHWPGLCDAVWADPPWLTEYADLYTWLGEWCPRVLKPGGFAFVQTGQRDIPDRVARLTAHGLHYHWTGAAVYEEAHRGTPAYGFACCWRPILILTNGPWTPARAVCSDVITIRKTVENRKSHHVWQQPPEIARHYLKLVPKRATVFVPFAGSGTELIESARLGHFAVGTEMDSGHFRTARARVLAELGSEEPPAVTVRTRRDRAPRASRG